MEGKSWLKNIELRAVDHTAARFMNTATHWRPLHVDNASGYYADKRCVGREGSYPKGWTKEQILISLGSGVGMVRVMNSINWAR